MNGIITGSVAREATLRLHTLEIHPVHYTAICLENNKAILVFYERFPIPHVHTLFWD